MVRTRERDGGAAGAKKRDGIRPRKERERKRTDLEVGEPENVEERKRESRDGSWRVYESGNERHTEGKGKMRKVRERGQGSVPRRKLRTTE